MQCGDTKYNPLLDLQTNNELQDARSRLEAPHELFSCVLVAFSPNGNGEVAISPNGNREVAFSPDGNGVNRPIVMDLKNFRDNV